MGLTASDSGGTKFEPIPQGLHHAICYGLYDLGTQFIEKFGKSVHKVLVQWELPNERIDIEREDGTVNLPRAASKQYTLSLHEKSNLRKELETWRGRSFTAEELKGFDLKKLLGANCQLQILHKQKDDKTYANVTAVLPLDRDNWKSPENKPRYFSFEEDGMHIPEDTPEWIVEIIKKSDEWREEGEPDSAYFDDGEPGYDDEIPF